MSVPKVATELRRQAIALRNGHAGTRRDVADGLLRLADSLEDPGHDIDDGTVLDLVQGDVVLPLGVLRDLMNAGDELAEAAAQHWDSEHMGGAQNRWTDALAEVRRVL